MRWKAIAIAGFIAGMLNQAVPVLAQTAYTYQCRDGAEFVFAVFEGRRAAYVQLDGKHLTLPQRLWLGAKRYSKSGIAITTKGNTAVLKRSGKKTDCEIVRTY